MTLTEEQRKQKQLEQIEYIEKHTVKHVRKIENGQQEYTCFLDNDNTLSFAEVLTEENGVVGGGVVLSRKYNPTNKPYWSAVLDVLDNYCKLLPEYYDEITNMLCKYNVLSEYIALRLVNEKFGKVYDEVDEKILHKKINAKNLNKHNEILSKANQILNDALLYMNCKTLNKKTGKYEEMPAEQRLKLVEKKFADAKRVIAQQFKDNKNEQANRNI